MAPIQPRFTRHDIEIIEEARRRGVSPSFPLAVTLTPKTEKDIQADFFVLSKMDPQMADAVTCIDCGLIWCKHVKKLILQGYDTVEHLWEPATERGEPMCIYVPLFPEVYNLWATVMLLEYDDDGKPFPGGIHKIALYLNQHMGEDQTTRWHKWHEEGLGYWCPGEGRMSLRSTIIDWLKSFPPRTCPSGAHDYRAAQRWSEGDENYRLASLYLIITQSACVACSEYTNFDNDAPEL